MGIIYCLDKNKRDPEELVKQYLSNPYKSVICVKQHRLPRMGIYFNE